MRQGKDKLRVLCFGYNGANNTGSEAKLLSTLDTIKRMLGDRLGELAVLTLDGDQQRRYLQTKHPEVRIIPIAPDYIFRHPLEGIRILFGPEYDITFLSEGSTFIDHFSSLFIWAFSGAALLSKFKGGHVVAYANDCGHLKSFNQKLLERTLNKVDLIMARNPDATARMKEYGVTKEIHTTADGAYTYPLPDEEYRKALFKKLGLDPARKILGLAPKEFFWWPIMFDPFGKTEDLYMYPFYHSWPAGGKESSARYIQQSIRHADWCVETYDMDVAIISMEHMDFVPSKKIYDGLKHKDRATIISSDDYVVDDIISVLSILDLLVTTRYHAVVLSSCSAVPMIAVSSDTRCEAVFRELEMMDLYVDYVKHPTPTPKVKNLDEVTIEMTKIAMAKSDELKKKIADAHPKFVQRSLMNEEILAHWLAETFPVK